MKRLLPLSFILVMGTALAAHEGVTNPAVKARMDGMTRIAKETKLLNQMASGKIPFARAKAEMAKEVLDHEADAIFTLFAKPEQDPKSEALPTIWTSFPDFAARASAFDKAVAELDPSNAQTLGASIQAVNSQCRSCHQSFRSP